MSTVSSRKDAGPGRRVLLRAPCSALLALFLFVWMPASRGAGAKEAHIHLLPDGTNAIVLVEGDPGDEWRFQASDDLASWINAPVLGSMFSGSDTGPSVSLGPANAPYQFLRAIQTDGLFDTNLLRTISLTFTNAHWATLLANARTRSTNVPCAIALDNGVSLTNIGARYKGNTSYQMGGAKKSVNLDIHYLDGEARVMGYRAINLNNAAGDQTIMREPLSFDALREYAPGPHGAMAKLKINGAYWGVYSMVDQINNDLLDEWFPSHTGDRWRALNMPGATGPGGGGGFSGSSSGFGYLGTNVSSYTRNFELKSDNSTNAWQRLVHAIDVLNNTPTNRLRDDVEEVLAVDRWLWFLAAENVFVDDDSYWNKGADYAFYYEPESGRIHPVEHDGNEALTSAMGATPTLSPVQGAADRNRPLLFKFLSIPELRQRYLAHVRTIVEERFKPDCLTDHELDLTGLYLTDEPDNPRKWPFPDGTTIPANGYLLVWADEDGGAPTGLHANFKLDKNGEQVFLIDADAALNAVLDSVAFGPQEADRSYRRLPTDADQFGSMEPTPGRVNVSF